MKIKEIISCLESFAPLSFQESYDNSGLITGDPGQDINSVLLCIDVTEEVINEAIKHGFGLDHFSPSDSFQTDQETQRVIIM